MDIDPQDMMLIYDGKPVVARADYKQDPLTGRYIIPYSLTETNLQPGVIAGHAERFTAAQKKAAMQVMSGIQQRVNIQFKEVSEVPMSEKSDRVLQFNQGDVTKEGIPAKNLFDIVNKVGDKLGLTHTKGCACNECTAVVIDNDTRSKWESLRDGYWEKGGDGWSSIAHEMLHTLGLKDTIKISPMITTDDSIMSYTPGTKSKDIREADYKALQHIFGEAPKQFPAKSPESKTPFTPATTPENVPTIKPFTPIEIIAAVGLGIATAIAAINYGASKIWSAFGGIAAAAAAIVGLKAWQSYQRGSITQPDAPQATTTIPPVSTSEDISVLSNPFPEGAPVFQAAGKQSSILTRNC